MPNYKGHLVGGLAAYGLLYGLLVGVLRPSRFTAFEWLIFTLAGALFPDIDTKSKGQKYFYYGAFLFFVILAMQEQFHMLTCCSFIIMLPLLVRHRGIFHSPRFVIAAPLIVWIFVSMVMPRMVHLFFFDTLFFIVGAFSHIWLDFGTSTMLRRLFIRKNRW